MEEGSYDLIFPVPREGRSPAQRWWTKNSHLFYLQGSWGVCGEVWIYGKDAHPTHKTMAELRFGEHPYMRGFNILCMAVQWDKDDKHSFLHPHAYDNVITGMMHGLLVVFKPNPFQLDRLMRLSRAADIPNLDVLIGQHMMHCEELLKGI